MAKNIFTVSQSKVKTYRRCKYAYYLRYVEKLRRKYKSRPLQFGSFVHAIAEADANNQDTSKAVSSLIKEQGNLFSAQRDELLEIAGDATTIMDEYFTYWEKAPKDEQLNYIRRRGTSAEHEITIPLVDGIEVTARLDNLASTGDRRKWLVERKSFGKMPNEDHRWRDLQSNLYVWLGQKVGIIVDGVCWDYIRSKPPSVPQMMKNGYYSKKRLDSLPSVLIDFFKKGKVEPDKKMIRDAEQNRSRYFIRKFNAIKPKLIKPIVDDFIETALEMKKNHGTVKARTIDRHCDWCEFEPICRAELTGADAKFVRKRDYYVKEKDEREITAE